MNILIAPDKFKGSLTAKEVCNAVCEGLQHINAQVTMVPLADGGEGTCELLTNFFSGSTIIKEVNDPLFSLVQSEYGISGDGTTAFIEMAKASGLQLINERKRNPLLTSTYGTGELVADALDKGVKKIILGIGGSATNDAGIGMASALGFEFLDSGNKILKPTGENLIRIKTILYNNIHPRIKEVEFIVLCDVTNPLFGEEGAAFVYGPQKGATAKMIDQLDEGLQNFSIVASQIFNTPANFPGAGAAGGLGAGAKIFLNATLTQGINHIIQLTRLEAKIQEADIVITGEGKIDRQSLSGKVTMAVSRLALSLGKPVLVACGKSELTTQELAKAGITEIISLVNTHTSEAEAMKNAYALLKNRIEVHFRNVP